MARRTIPLHAAGAIMAAWLMCLGVGYMLGAISVGHEANAGTGGTSGRMLSANPPGGDTTASGTSNVASYLKIDTPRRQLAKPYYANGTTVHGRAPPRQPVCTNTCHKARNGVCDDGRLKPRGPVHLGVRMVYCDLGTDCEDCGPWDPTGHMPWVSDGVPGPIARLTARGVEVRVRRSAVSALPGGSQTAPQFDFAYTDPGKDVDVSHHMETGGMVEAGITQVFSAILSQGCAPTTPTPARTRTRTAARTVLTSVSEQPHLTPYPHPGLGFPHQPHAWRPRQRHDSSSSGSPAGATRAVPRQHTHRRRAMLRQQLSGQGADPLPQAGVFVDVGANFGWFSVLAAALGCRVVAFEPVPHFHAFLEYSVHLNGLADRVDMRGNLVSHVSNTELTMVVPSHGIWGTAGIDGLNIDKAITQSTNEAIQVVSQRLDEVIAQDVLLMKVDVEGWEWSVIQGAAGLLAHHDVANVVMEYSPGVPERSFRYKEMTATVSMLLNLVDSYGFRIAQLGENSKHAVGPNGVAPMEEITAHTLMYDLVDVELFGRQQLGCPVPEPLAGKFFMWSRCQAVPEDISPRSLRSTLGHNTNIWAAKGPHSLQVLQGVVGILKPDTPPEQYFVDPAVTRFGMGSRVCDHLSPEVQVRHRCPCGKPEVCGAEEAAVKQVAAQSEGVPSSYTLSPDGALVTGTGGVAALFRDINTARDIATPYAPGTITGMLS